MLRRRTQSFLRTLLLPSLFALLAAASADAQTRIRVSVKHVLDAAGQRSQGFYSTDSSIENAIDVANIVLANNGFSWELWLTDIQDVAGISQYHDLSGVGEMRALESAARADPVRYKWSTTSINFYVVNNIPGFGGYCSFPRTAEIIAINNTLGILGGGIGWLHEIGHYLSLTHTFENCHLRTGGPGAHGMPIEGGGFDGRMPCTGAGATHNGFCSAVEICNDVCPDTTNVMSYNSFSVGVATLTPCQKGHMDFELFDPGGARAKVVSMGTCVVDDALAASSLPTGTRDLLHLIRDGVLRGTPQGARWVEMYYQHGAELVRITRENPDLKTRCTTLLATISPGLRALREQDDSVRVPAAAVALLDGILQDYERAAPHSALAADLRTERARLDLTRLAGESYTGVWQRINHEATRVTRRSPAPGQPPAGAR